MDRAVEDRGERRAAPRQPATTWAWEPYVALRSGELAAVVNWSQVGLLVEVARQFAPGTRVSLSLRGHAGALTLHGRIVRASVCGVTANAGVSYHVGIQTDGPIAPSRR